MRWIFGFVFLLFGCEQPQEKVRIAINPWPGYEFLHLAEKKGFFEEEGLPVELVQVASLSDAQSVYVNNNVEGITSTLIEAVQIAPLGGKPARVILVIDFSNGADVIIGNNIQTPEQLKGKRVGAEVGSLGLYVLSRALQSVGLSLDDVQLINVEQSETEYLMLSDELDAVVTYAPYSVDLLRHQHFSTLFDSAMIPGEVVDVVSVSQEVLDNNPHFIEKFHRVWTRVINYYAEHPEASIAIMAKRQRIHSDEFIASMEGLKILSLKEQQDLLLKNNKINDTANQVCEVLLYAGAFDGNCDHTVALFSLKE
ncbi:ABC transporter substrate-binding protein [Thaumasiovibrio subtropicus]|uniref:ABC transporter substrate-binding protein n=1 Tax=Thaumasiovibrio subtropicus TaxID=1891207 RepID=UPI000B34BB8E|nr:ABC transporter substrate-binding protein [Thaumasiovibrio subtropicus]